MLELPTANTAFLLPPIYARYAYLALLTQQEFAPSLARLLISMIPQSVVAFVPQLPTKVMESVSSAMNIAIPATSLNAKLVKLDTIPAVRTAWPVARIAPRARLVLVAQHVTLGIMFYQGHAEAWVQPRTQERLLTLQVRFTDVRRAAKRVQ